MDDFALANKYLDAGNGDKALPIFTRLAEQGRLDAMHSIGHSYLYGIGGFPLDYDLAFTWFTRAAGLGCPQAMYHLGLCNAEGYGTPVDPERSLAWYKQSAEHGDEDAMFRVGDCFERGFGADASPAQAKKWYKRAASFGQTEAADRLKKMKD